MSEEVGKTAGSSRSVILLIENDENDVFIFRRALAAAGFMGDVRVVGSATEARVYLEHDGPFDDPAYYPTPRMLVSDYRLAGQTAMEFLRWLKGESAYRDIPILVISGAVRSAEGEKLKELGALGFVAKTGDVAAFAEALKPFLPFTIDG
jgi:CheY-like chemotaxis protein